jgi:predicted unusual protein kinase regulating ubiquinone biosynthesis (AarF/ABC1/UbiB family)
MIFSRTSESSYAAVSQVTEGPDAGKLALLDFGLVAEIPAQDRAAMVRGQLHTALNSSIDIALLVACAAAAAVA